MRAPRIPYFGSGYAVADVSREKSVATRLDAALGTVPGVGLFRRANSFTAHPTTQGLSMRGVGANAAGRALVTLDGVPINDPFGGWVYWSTIPDTSLEFIRVRKGGAPGAFGAQALAGAVQLATEAKLQHAGQAELGANDFRNLSVDTGLRFGQTTLKLSGGLSETDGDFLLAESDRGPVDVRAASKLQRIGASVSREFGPTAVQASVRYFEEDRTNGLALAVNSTEALDLSLRLVNNDAAGTDWEITAYYRDRDFANMFASARDDRTTERAVLDQFDVPAWGAGLLARIQFDGFEVGFDGRRMSGETNERFRNLGQGFSRQRRAGGDQWTLGFYGEYNHSGEWGNISATVRYDRWRTYNGVRDEFNIEDGFPGFASPDRSDVIPDRKGGVWTGRLGFEKQLTGAIDLRAAAYKSWRLPTLNEYYRPFRVVNDITEANANLRPEKLYGIEVGFDYQPLNTIQASLTLFRNWLVDGVGNVTIGFGPGFFELGGFVPAGGSLRQRNNIDRSVTDGIELDGQVELSDGWTFGAAYLYARARITEFDAMPNLVGKRPIQTPRHSATLSATYDGSDNLGGRVEMRYSSSQYDDDLNTRRLEAIVTFNAGANYRLNDAVNLTANIENLFDAKVVSALSASGLETLAQRRFWRIGLAATF